MSARLEDLARDKELLLTQSALCRMRLRRETHALRQTLPWRRSAVAVVRAPTVQRIVLGLAVSLVGLGRTARLVMLAGRIVLIAKLAGAVVAWARGPRRFPGR